MRSRRHSVVLASLALAAATLLAGCGSEKTDRLKADNGGAVEGGTGITPTKLTAHEGRKVEIEVTNTSKDKEHGFSIDDFNLHEVIGQGKTSTVKFKADKAGTFKVYCQLHPAHKPAELVVS